MPGKVPGHSFFKLVMKKDETLHTPFQCKITPGEQNESKKSTTVWVLSFCKLPHALLMSVRLSEMPSRAISGQEMKKIKIGNPWEIKTAVLWILSIDMQKDFFQRLSSGHHQNHQQSPAGRCTAFGSMTHVCTLGRGGSCSVNGFNTASSHINCTQHLQHMVPRFPSGKYRSDLLLFSSLYILYYASYFPMTSKPLEGIRGEGHAKGRGNIKYWFLGFILPPLY